jgi:hypothetical protein
MTRLRSAGDHGLPRIGTTSPIGRLPNNFKPNIQKYDSRSNPNIWLSTYYVTVKVAGGNFDHMAAYFPAGSITS